MVAKAAWTTVEPQINLAAYMAGDEAQLFPPALSWAPGEWAFSAEEHVAMRCGDGETPERDLSR
jgi:hypothetical protein